MAEGYAARAAESRALAEAGLGRCRGVVARVVAPAIADRGVRRGQIFWVDFEPSRGSEQAGRRPALVIQNDVGNRYSPNTIVAAMTTKLGDKAYPTEVRLSDDLFGKPSVVLCAQVLTVSQERLGGPAVAQLDAGNHGREWTRRSGCRSGSSGRG